ncbi:DNA helicase [Helicobacter phage UKEN32U]|nr:DNA helicase [Helicobacter phage UKEN32U]
MSGLERIKRKKNYKLAQIVRLAILQGLKHFKKDNLLVHLTLKEFDSFLEVLEEKNDRKKH